MLFKFIEFKSKLRSDWFSKGFYWMKHWLTKPGRDSGLKRTSKEDVFLIRTNEIKPEIMDEQSRTFHMASRSDPSRWIPASSERLRSVAKRSKPLIIK